MLLRDGVCRCGLNCGYRHGLEVHHLVPRSWGGTDDLSNLVAVFAGHHPDLVPHGPWALVGNPNQPDGLRRVRYDHLTPDEARQYGLPPRAKTGLTPDFPESVSPKTARVIAAHAHQHLDNRGRRAAGRRQRTKTGIDFHPRTVEVDASSRLS